MVERLELLIKKKDEEDFTQLAEEGSNDSRKHVLSQFDVRWSVKWGKTINYQNNA